VIGADTNADHIAAWRIDPHDNPLGNPRRFDFDLSGRRTIPTAIALAPQDFAQFSRRVRARRTWASR
jgi:hypothetical protein